MSTKNTKVSIKSISQAALKKIEEEHDLKRIIFDRYSKKILFDLFVAENLYHRNIFCVIDEIKSLEGLGIKTHTKPATMFNKLPLKGLFHKHYSDAHFLLKNLTNYWTPNKLDELIHDSLGEAGVDSINLLIYNYFNGFYVKRHLNKLTGEWIIFAKYQNRNYYLCLGQHSEKDSDIYQQIVSICAYEFPFLKKTLNMSEATLKQAKSVFGIIISERKTALGVSDKLKPYLIFPHGEKNSVFGIAINMADNF